MTTTTEPGETGARAWPDARKPGTFRGTLTFMSVVWLVTARSRGELHLDPRPTGGLVARLVLPKYGAAG